MKAKKEYDKEADCVICTESLLGKYVFEFGCDETHVFHRHCILSNIMEYQRYKCPSLMN